jgi:tRNA threonylcarbamoyladenosine biosynthesis protein TsaB
MLVAIETSTDVGSIAIGEGATLADEVVIGVRTRHAESLLPALEFLLRSARLKRSDVTGIVVGAGPGSFTGVRVAAATARGLAHGLDVPLYAYSSLASLAVQAGSAGPVCALLDARRGEVYAACYEAAHPEAGGAATALPRALLEPVALTVPDLLARMADVAPLYAGEGAERYAAALGVEPRTGLSPRASALLRLAAADSAGVGRVQDRAGWEPTYLRASGAERGIAG